MRTQALPLTVWMAGVLSLAGACPGAEAPVRSPLQDVAALEKPVTLTETKIPLGELLQKVAAATGIKLVATADVADEPVAVVVKELLARELLKQLAELLDEFFVPAAGRAEIRIPVGTTLYPAIAYANDLAGPDGANAGEMAFVTGHRHPRQAAGDRLCVWPDTRHDGSQPARHGGGEKEVVGLAVKQRDLAGYVPG